MIKIRRLTIEKVVSWLGGLALIALALLALGITAALFLRWAGTVHFPLIGR